MPFLLFLVDVHRASSLVLTNFCPRHGLGRPDPKRQWLNPLQSPNPRAPNDYGLRLPKDGGRMYRSVTGCVSAIYLFPRNDKLVSSGGTLCLSMPVSEEVSVSS